MNFFPGIFLVALALSATSAAGAILAGRLTGRRLDAAREREFRAMFSADPPNDPAREVEVLLQNGDRCLAWHRPPVGWIDIESLTRICDADVVGWRKPPFARDHPEDDPADWSIERLQTELDRRFPPQSEAKP